MFKKIEAPDNVVAFTLSGKLSQDDMTHYETAFRSRRQKPGKLGICVDFTGLEDISPAGLMEGAKADLEFLRHIKQFKRMAVVSDKEWPGVVVGLAKSMLPTMEFKLFEPDQQAQAVKWAAETSVSKADVKGTTQMLKTSRDDVLAIEIDGIITPDATATVMDDLERRLASHDKISVLVHFKHFGGIDPAVFMQSGLISTKFEAMRKLERYAVIGAPQWMQKVVGAVGPMVPGAEIRSFAADQEAEAWVWMGAKRI